MIKTTKMGMLLLLELYTTVNKHSYTYFINIYLSRFLIFSVYHILFSQSILHPLHLSFRIKQEFGQNSNIFQTLAGCLSWTMP